MSLLAALVLGLVQGLTEFFPISSSAHLKLAKLLLGLEHVEHLVIFDLVCHLGTLTALLYFLRREILELDRRKIALLVVATLPLIPIYFLLKPLREFASQTPLLGIFLIVTALILFLGSRLRIKKPFKKEVHSALVIGAMQGAALIPGISRSASTISTATYLGWNAKEAVRFSFLLSIPTIIGGNCLELLKMSLTTGFSCPISLSSCLIGFSAACIAGLATIGFAMRILEKGRLAPFAWYCLALGIMVILFHG